MVKYLRPSKIPGINIISFGHDIKTVFNLRYQVDLAVLQLFLISCTVLRITPILYKNVVPFTSYGFICCFR